MKHVHEYVAKGRVYRYFRHGKSKIRLYGEPDSPEFIAQYNELLASVSVTREPIAPGTIAALIMDYKRSPEFAKLKPKSQHSYAVNLDRLADIGHGRLDALKRMHILALRDNLSEHPRTADVFIQVTTRLLNWGVDRGYLEANPAANVKRINKYTPYKKWTSAECQVFEDSLPREALMTAYMLGRYTGQRRGDVLRMVRTRYDGAAIEVVQRKTDTPLWIPCHARLKTYLDTLPTDRLLFIVTRRGRAWDDANFSHQFIKQLRKAGLDHLTFHGLRHTAATALAEAGCSNHEIMAITGHATSAMVDKYTRTAEQKKRASAAILKLERGQG